MHTKILFPFEVFNALDEKHILSRHLFQNLFQGQQCTFNTLQSYVVYHHITNLHIVNFNGFIVSYIISFIKYKYLGIA